MNFSKGSNSKNESSIEESKLSSDLGNISRGLINGSGNNKLLLIFVSLEFFSFVLMIGNNL
jgi:hypothetical protein